MEGDNGAHALPIDDAGALQQGMEGDDDGIDQGVEVGDAGVDQGVEEEGMEDGDDDALQDMEGEQGQGMEVGDAGLEEAMEHENGALQQDMEGDDSGLEQGMEAGDAGIDHGMENGDNGALQDIEMEEGEQAQGMEAGDAGIDVDHGMENGNDGALQDMEEGEQAQGMEGGDAGVEQAMENSDDAGVEQAMEDGDDAGVEQAMEDGDDAGVEQGMEDDDDDVVGLDQFIEEMGGGVGLLPENHVLPLSIPEYEASPDYLLLQWSEFERSGPLETVVLLADRDGDGDGPPETVGPLFRNGDYRSIDTILPEETTALINEVFNARTHAVIEAVLLDGRRIQLDFLRKICVEVDEEGTPLRIVAMYWVDDQHRVFVSARIFGMDEEVVRQRFMEECGGRLVITAVRRCFHRLHAMNPFCERMQAENPVFGWYGAEAEAVEHGAFQDEALHANWQRLEIPGFERAHGHGVHIAPMRRIMKSALVSVAGALGQPGHMLLCALALGSRERVPEGSEQDSPSNPLFQSGVVLDERGDPSWHIIWETSGPGGVLPLYVVTFVVPAGH